MDTSPDLSEAVDAIKNQQFERASNFLSRILEQDPDHLEAGWLAMQCKEQMQDREGAVAQFARLVDRVSGDIATIGHLARIAFQNAYPMDGIIEACRDHCNKHPDSADAAFNLAYFLSNDGQHRAAIEAYQEALKLDLRAPEQAEMNIASIYMDQLDDPGKATRHLQQARSLNPLNGAVYYNLGNLAEQSGDRTLAAHNFEKALELDPGNDPVLARLADTHRFADAEDPLLKRMVAAAPATTSRDLHFALGRAYDQLGDFKKAWHHFSQANDQDAQVFPPYLPEQAGNVFERIMETSDQDWISASHSNSNGPVFICGLYRTGTTLLEQVIGAHPSFTAGGESEFFPRLVARHFPYYPDGLSDIDENDILSWRAGHEQLQQLKAGSSRLTDKRPDNFLCAGLIRKILPSARFVVTERDPRDTAVSIFATRLGPRQNYATRLEHIRHYIGLHRKLVDHWVSVMGDAIYRIRYEDLVEQPRESVESLLNWLGEEWDDRCLEFHRQAGAVRTASVWQVREPLHTRSVGRWRNYSTPVEAAFRS